LVGVGPEAWTAYEEGLTVPAEVVLAFIDVADWCLRWLLTGWGEKSERQRTPGGGPQIGGRTAPAQGIAADRRLAPSCLVV
jgi:hypothetical protein